MELAWRTLVAATRDPQFWRCYAFDGDDGFDFEAAGERLARQLNEVDVADEDWDEEDEDDLSSARVILPARRGWWLKLELNFELALHVLYLQRDDEERDEPDDEDEDWDDDEDYAVPDVSVELGHWDQARWHPFCLRWSELEAVVAQLRAAPDRHPLPPEVGMLLLARWVGHGSDETALLDERRAVLAGTFERLGLFHGAEAARMAAQLMQAVPEDDYAWRWDGGRGWLLGGDYAGYSIRNDSHGRFPFPEFTEFRRQLGVADGPDGQS
ncbi:hypothetical protein ACFO1B_22250 [Dactylosporangium siamense]|uniref:Uncharacterized protein n=1 Tax=Dactylosporangium siamense TaxID=685454 RepID=A0A919PT56_9ACTN|nr:hypothetical protein [Dactylosporangium siamense]GIG50116.1 hypothetical protein Dsi01nite_081570 [Dactylosporangium siamense]